MGDFGGTICALLERLLRCIFDVESMRIVQPMYSTAMFVMEAKALTMD